MPMDLSRAPGNIVDWVYKKMGVKYSFAAHLRDTGTVSLCFQPPNFGECLMLSESTLSMASLSRSNGFDQLAKKPRK
jgi:hypothetical protein